jgi:cytoskeletal protein RodZ
MSEAVPCRSTSSSDRQSRSTKQLNPKPGVFEMTKIALTAAAILVATGSAFASSDHYGSTNANQPTVTIDRTVTTSITKSDVDVRKPDTQGANRDLFGNH